MENRILFIIEGESDEKKFLERMIQICCPQSNYSIYTYKTTLHTLAQVLYKEYPDFDSEEIDIKLVLRSHETDYEKIQLLNKKYRDIYLVFDFEPHHDHPHFDTVRRMMSYFNDSVEHGKLYINYPMMQSYKHLSQMPDEEFYSRTVSCDDVGNYKNTVANESYYTNLDKYTYTTFASLAAHHIKKANLLQTELKELPTIDEYILWSGIKLFDIEMNLLTTQKIVSVLNTSIFIFVDFAPREYFRNILQHKAKFDY